MASRPFASIAVALDVGVDQEQEELLQGLVEVCTLNAVHLHIVFHGDGDTLESRLDTEIAHSIQCCV